MKPFVRLFLSLAVCVIVLVGCKRKPAPEPVPTAPAEVPTAAPATPAPQPGPSASPVASTREIKDDGYTKEMTQTLNDFLGDYIKQKKRIPRDVGEMVALKIITSIPVLPNGKKWVIDQQTGKISAQ